MKTSKNYDMMLGILRRFILKPSQITELWPSATVIKEGKYVRHIGAPRLVHVESCMWRCWIKAGTVVWRSGNALDSKPQNTEWPRRWIREKTECVYLYLLPLQVWQKQAREPHSCGRDGTKAQYNTSSVDETKLNTPSVTLNCTKRICGSSEMENARVACQFPLQSTCTSFGVRARLFPLRVQHLFMRRTTHRDRQRHTRWGYFTGLLQAWHRNKVRSFPWSSN